MGAMWKVLASVAAAQTLELQIPLYLFHSQLNADFALLAAAPPEQVPDADSYVLFDAEPVGYGSKDPFTIYGENSTLLINYWSPSRKDIQTTDWTLERLNEHGGDYVLLNKLVHVAKNVPHYVAGTPFVPLTLVYSDSRTDGITSPFNGADVNAIVAANPPSPFRDIGTVLGYMRQGNCTKCNVGLSETFPSAGGADCMNMCAAGTSSFAAIYRIGQGSMATSAAGRTFAASMLAAGNVVRGFDSTVNPESGAALHISLNYFCCYTREEKAKIRAALSAIHWRPINVTFDRAEWRIDNNGSPADHYSVCVFLDEASNERMLTWVAEVEAAVTTAGVPIHVTRTAQEPFHSTLAVVNGTTFPLEAALAAINQLVPPEGWTGEMSLEVTKPSW